MTEKLLKDTLTNLSRMELPSLINWTSPFSFQGLLGGILHFYYPPTKSEGYSFGVVHASVRATDMDLWAFLVVLR